MKIDKQKLILISSILIYIISLTQKSYCSSYGICKNLGISSLAFGWLGVVMLHIPAFVWLANPTLLISWFFYRKKPRISIVFNLFTTLIMISFLMVDEIINNEAGIKSKVTYYGLGYWLWILSSNILLIGNFINWKNNKYKPQPRI